MNKAVIGVVIALIVGSGLFVVLSGGDDESESANTSNTTQSTSQTEAINQPSSDADEEIESMQQSIDEAEQREAEASAPSSDASSSPGGSYIEYTGSEIADASGTKRVLFFHAEWCGVCNFFEDDIKSAGVPDGVTIIEADFDKDTALKQEYGVTVQSTFIVLDDNGNAVQTWPFASGLQGASDLFAQI